MLQIDVGQVTIQLQISAIRLFAPFDGLGMWKSRNEHLAAQVLHILPCSDRNSVPSTCGVAFDFDPVVPEFYL